MSTTRRSLRIISRLIFAAFWIIVILLALEVAERARVAWLADAKQQLNNQQVTRMREAGEALPPPANRPAWAAAQSSDDDPPLAELDPTDLDAFLNERKSFAAVVDAEGAIRRLLPDTPDPSLQRLYRLVQDAGTMLDGLELFLQNEIRDAIKNAQRGEPSPVDHFKYSFGPEDSDMFMLQTQPWPESGTAVILARQSLWQEWMFSFSPHVYVPDNYGREEIWTNALGYRDDEIIVPKPDGVYRILCIGGSTTLEGVRNDHTYPNLLEEILRSALQFPKLEVINLGVYGLNSENENELLDDYLRLDPDFIIHYNFINDLSPLVELVLAESSDPRVALWPLLTRWTFAHRYLNRWFMPGQAQWLAWMDHTTLQHRRRLIEATAERGIPLALASFAHPDLAASTFPEYEKYRDMSIWLFDHSYVSAETYIWLCTLYNDAIQDMAEANDHVAYLPIAEQLTGTGDTFIDICHLSHQGIHRKADLMFEEVLRLIAADLDRAE